MATRKVFIDKFGMELTFKTENDELVIWFHCTDDDRYIHLNKADALEFISELYRIRKSL